MRLFTIWSFHVIDQTLLVLLLVSLHFGNSPSFLASLASHSFCYCSFSTSTYPLNFFYLFLSRACLALSLVHFSLLSFISPLLLSPLCHLAISLSFLGNPISFRIASCSLSAAFPLHITMVLILGGEVVADDDPRAIAYRRRNAAPSSGSGAARGNATENVADRQQFYQRRPDGAAAGAGGAPHAQPRRAP